MIHVAFNINCAYTEEV